MTMIKRDVQGYGDYAILASKDLLEACEAIYRVAEHASLPGPIYISISERDMLRNAIDKAKGKP